MISLARWHCSPSLSNYVYNFLSKLLITASGVDFCSVAFVSVLSFYGFILSVLLKCSDLFNIFLLLMCSRPFFVCLVCSISFDTIFFSLATQPSTYFARQFFPFEISAKDKSVFSTFFPLQLHIFSPGKTLFYLLSRYLWLIGSGGFSLKQLLKVALLFFDHSLVFHSYILSALRLFQLFQKRFTLCDRFFCYLFGILLVRL